MRMLSSRLRAMAEKALPAATAMSISRRSRQWSESQPMGHWVAAPPKMAAAVKLAMSMSERLRALP